jgi:hypothetical protein
MPLQICNETQYMDALRCGGLKPRKLELNNFSQVQKSFKVSPLEMQIKPAV